IKNQLHEGRDPKYLDESTHERLVRLAVRAIAANTGLLRYLARSTAPEPFRKPKTRPAPTDTPRQAAENSEPATSNRRTTKRSASNPRTRQRRTRPDE